MIAYITRRLIQAVFILIIVSVIVFLVIRLLPGDPILIYLSHSNAEALTPEQIAIVRHEFGLDKPLPVQYFDWISGLSRGDFGTSIHYRQSVGMLLSERLPVTLHLGLLSFVLGAVAGILMGLVAALRRASWLDTVTTTLANFGISAPNFWLGILLIYAFGLQLGWLPIYGYTSPFEDFWLSTRQLIMPVLVLAAFSLTSIARQTRSSMLEVIRQDYVRTAWAKGLQERVVVSRHIVKNGLIPVITLMGIQFSHILGGAVIIENVFSIPGMGRLMVEGLFAQDYQIIQAGILISAAMVVIANLIVDISYGWIDPRIRYG